MFSYRSFLIPLLGLFLLTGCRLQPTVRPVPAVALPASYGSPSDSAGIGRLPYRTLLADPYLVALIDTALVRNQNVRIAYENLQAARAAFSISQAALLPQVEATATAGLDRFGRYTLNGVGNFDTNLSDNVTGPSRIPNPTPDLFLGFRAGWEADLWGKLRFRRRAAFLRMLASGEGRNLVVTNLVAEVARSYFTLLALDAERKIIADNIALQEQALRLVEVQKAAGRVTELAVQQFRAQWLGTRSLQGRVQQEIAQVENSLNVLLGRFPQPIARGRSLLDRPLPGAVAAGLPAQLLRNRPDIRQAERELEAANIDVAAAQAQFMPSLTLTPYLGLNAFRPEVLLNPASLATGILGSLTAPILNRRALKGDLQIAQALNRQAYYAYQRVIQTGVAEVTTSLQGLTNYQTMAEQQTEEVNVLRQAARTADDLFVSGYATYLEVITAQRSVLDAELNLIGTKRTQFTTLVDLYRSLGGGWQPSQ